MAQTRQSDRMDALDQLSAEARTALALASPTMQSVARHVLACSVFVSDCLQRDPPLLGTLLATGVLEQSRKAASLALPAGAPEAQFMAELRRLRCREMLRIAWRDLAGWASVEQTLEDLSAFADEAISLAMQRAWSDTTARYGTPRAGDGSGSPLIVVGMGKLGGRELNFSSDIDLVFLFPEYGETDHAAPVSNEEFHLRLGQALIRLLSAPTVDGIVFRVDMRLRPFGDSGPLACGFDAFEDYLTQHGRDWERYAWVKARAVTSSDVYAPLFESVVRPFVYRRYLDFGVFESLREMKQLIARQVARRELMDNVKLGPGGIREIEFIVQAYQLIRGGQDKRLQQPNLLSVLPLLAGGRLLPGATVHELATAYRYLRCLENRLQMIADEQTHSLPVDDANKSRLMQAMGHGSWQELVCELDAQRAVVKRHFELLVFAVATDTPSHAHPAIAELGPLWDADASIDLLRDALQRSGVNEAAEAARLLADYRSSGVVRRLDAAGNRRLQALLPALIAELRPQDATAAVVRRLLRVLESIGSRSSYFALLNENHTARRRFVEVCRSGDFLAAQIAAHPLLLDELIDDRIFSEPPSREELAADLRDRLARVDADDPEQHVELLCQFKRAAVFRVAVADLAGRLPVMRVSDRLTDIAELLVKEALSAGLRQMGEQFGLPHCDPGAQRRPVRLCAVGYGKLGGLELGYASDLDLVFLHDSSGEQQETDAATPVDNQVFFVRLAQRVVHILTVHSAAGRLYEVDQRLRPSGKGGMLITQIGAFGDYQRNEAWTWEHQALLHARAVAGSPALCTEFERLRLDIVTHHVRRESLRDEVRSMRERMRRELSKAGRDEFDLKQDRGGIADIEFLAQYWTLLHAAAHPAVAMFSDTIRQLESLASGDLVPQLTVDVLTGAYRDYRARGHHRSLDESPAIASNDEFVAQRRAVTAIWDECFGV